MSNSRNFPIGFKEDYQIITSKIFRQIDLQHRRKVELTEFSSRNRKRNFSNFHIVYSLPVYVIIYPNNNKYSLSVVRKAISQELNHQFCSNRPYEGLWTFFMKSHLQTNTL